MHWRKIGERARACVCVPSIFIFGWKSGPEIAASCNDQCDNNNFIDKNVIVLVLLDRKFTSPSLFTHAFSCVSIENNNNDNGEAAEKNQPIRSTISQSKIISKKSEIYSLLFYYSVPFLSRTHTHFLHSHFWCLSFFISFVRSFRFFWIDYYIVSWFSPIAKCESWVCVSMFSLCSLLHVIPE